MQFLTNIHSKDEGLQGNPSMASYHYQTAAPQHWIHCNTITTKLEVGHRRWKGCAWVEKGKMLLYSLDTMQQLCEAYGHILPHLL
jgi:hypothetical protein